MFTPAERDQMAELGIVEEVQDYYARKYLAEMRRIDYAREQRRQRAEAEAAHLAQMKWEVAVGSLCRDIERQLNRKQSVLRKAP